MSFDSSDKSPISLACEILKDKFYFLTSQNVKLKSTKDVYYFCTDEQFLYRNFNQDFGPFNLAMLCRYCLLVNKKLESFQAAGKKLCHVTSFEPKKRTNAAFLVGCFSVLMCDKTPEETVRCLITQHKVPVYLPFRDVSLGPSLYNLGLLDCLKALVKARSLGIFDVNTFNVVQYEYLEKMVNGDINWIIPEKFLAFPGPHNKPFHDKGFPVHSPDFYVPYFLENNVSTVVRLNKEMYQAKKFTDAGINHVDIYFPDGTVPSLPLVEKFIDICEKAPGAIAVHCKAGLGRTGTMIGCYMMKNMMFTAAEAIAWIRMARPGSVIGMQQIFLNDIQKYLWIEGAKRQKLTSSDMSCIHQQSESKLQQHQQGSQLWDPWTNQQCQKRDDYKHDHQQQLFQDFGKHIRKSSTPVNSLEYRQQRQSLVNKVSDFRQVRQTSVGADESELLTQGDILNRMKMKRQSSPKNANETNIFSSGKLKLSLWPRSSYKQEGDQTAQDLLHPDVALKESYVRERQSSGAIGKDQTRSSFDMTTQQTGEGHRYGRIFNQRMQDIEQKLYNNNNTQLDATNKTMPTIFTHPLQIPNVNLEASEIQDAARSNKRQRKNNRRSDATKLCQGDKLQSSDHIRTSTTVDKRKPGALKNIPQNVVNSEHVMSNTLSEPPNYASRILENASASPACRIAVVAKEARSSNVAKLLAQNLLLVKREERFEKGMV